jgi:hypothetical protein
MKCTPHIVAPERRMDDAKKILADRDIVRGGV